MMRSLCLILLLIFSACGTSTRPPAELSTEDFRVGNLFEGKDSLFVRSEFGQPDSLRVTENSLDSGTYLVFWHYPGLTVDFAASGTIHGLTLRSPQYDTYRGLRVGESVERVIELYGQPSHTYMDEWEYVDPNNELHVIRVMTRENAVREIFVGWLYD